jgi:SAM-dependent methyltransferase
VTDLAASFGSVAEAYERGRPHYEPHVIELLGETAGPRILDVGAGTGRLSAPLLRAGYDVVAVEPLDEMRAILAGHIGSERAHAGRAEALPLDDASVDGAVCADAWHWFDGARATDELARVIRPGGAVVVCVTYPTWADEDAPDWWLDLRAVHTALPKGDHPALVRGWRRPDSFDGHAAFDETRSRSVPFVHRTDRAGIVAHWASMSFVASLPGEQREMLLHELEAMLARRDVDEVDVPYRAELWITRRRRAAAPPADPPAAAS